MNNDQPSYKHHTKKRIKFHSDCRVKFLFNIDREMAHAYYNCRRFYFFFGVVHFIYFFFFLLKYQHNVVIANDFTHISNQIMRYENEGKEECVRQQAKDINYDPQF